MASINDLAVAATIASSAVALQSSPRQEASASAAAAPPPPGTPPPAAGAAAGSPSQGATPAQPEPATPGARGATTIARGAPVLAAPAAGAAGEGRAKAVRGAFVVFEGMDRAGKTTQAKLLQQRCIESGREARFLRFPDRTTPIGQMIDAYLRGEAEIEDHVIHLLFSANRWEAVKKIRAELEAGHTIVCDRFYHSGIVYSAAKGVRSLSLSWAKAPEVGLPRPDVVLFLDLEEAAARARGGWGGEVYEKGEMQRRVRDLFWGLSMGDLGTAVDSGSAAAAAAVAGKAPRRDADRAGNGAAGVAAAAATAAQDTEFRQEEEDIQIVDADLPIEELSDKVWELVLPRIEAVERGEVGRTVRTVR